jgi:hypothetical protein
MTIFQTLNLKKLNLKYIKHNIKPYTIKAKV